MSGTDDWMFGPVGLSGLRKGDEPEEPAPEPDITKTPTERLPSVDASPSPPPPPAPDPPPPPAPRPLTEAELQKKRVLEHTAKLRRALMGGPEPKAPEKPPEKARTSSEGAATKPPEKPPANEDTAALRRAIIDRTQSATLRDLEKKGVKNVKVLGMATIERIVAEAVENALERSHRHLSSGARRALEQEAKREFLELLDEHKRALAAKSDEERRRLDLEKTVEKLREELARQEDALAQEREVLGVTMSPQSLAELEASVKGMLAAFMTDERRKQVAEGDPRLAVGLDELERKLAEAFDRLVGRMKSDHEDVLERRIAKLNKALAQTEDALRRVAQMKSVDDGIASIYDSVQGLALDALNFSRKKELLAVVFLENLELQKKEITEQDRAAAVVKAPLDPRPAELGPMDGFEPPVEPMTTETAF